VRTIIPSQRNPLKQEPDYSLQVIPSQNWTRQTDHLPDQDCSSGDQSDQTCNWNWLTLHKLAPCPQFFCLFKLIAHVCTPKMAEDGLSAYSASSHTCPQPCNKPPFFAFTMPLYLIFRDGWPDLASGISAVWALGPKLQFQS
jgi:hypothetical protein